MTKPFSNIFSDKNQNDNNNNSDPNKQASSHSLVSPIATNNNNPDDSCKHSTEVSRTNQNIFFTSNTLERDEKCYFTFLKKKILKIRQYNVIKNFLTNKEKNSDDI